MGRGVVGGWFLLEQLPLAPILPLPGSRIVPLARIPSDLSRFLPLESLGPLDGNTTEQQGHRHEQTNQALRKEMQDWQAKAERYKKELDSSETSSDTLRSEYRTTKAQLEAYQMELGTMRSTLFSLEKDHQESLSVLLKKEADIDRLNGIIIVKTDLHHAASGKSIAE